MIIGVLLLLCCLGAWWISKKAKVKRTETENGRLENNDMLIKNKKELEKIYLAGGCFWGVEEYFSRIPGVVDTVSGYANGADGKTTYHEIAKTGHAETVEVSYDKNRVSLEELLLRYFHIIDPYSVNQQGNDRGTQYRTGIYFTNPEQEKIVRKVVKNREEAQGGAPFAVEVEGLKNFIKAEDYHQDYLANNPGGYCHINVADATRSLDGKEYKAPSREEIRSKLTDEQYKVSQEKGTEYPGTGEYDKFNEEGIYVDVVTGQPLFSSRDKYDAGCGWPSFTRPITSDAIRYLNDSSHGMQRVEVESRDADTHLGHVFDDGPQEAGGLRYCINAASLRFIPYDKLDDEGYGIYKVFVK